MSALRDCKMSRNVSLYLMTCLAVNTVGSAGFDYGARLSGLKRGHGGHCYLTGVDLRERRRGVSADVRSNARSRHTEQWSDLLLGRIRARTLCPKA